jgi:chromosome segregation ATPase
MDKTRRAVSITIIVLSAIFLVISLVGIILTWSFYQRLNDELMSRLETIEADLRSAQSDLQTVKAELDAVQEQIDALQAALQILGVDGSASLEDVAALIGRLEGTLTPFITGVAERVEDLRDAVVRLKETIERLNELPLVNLRIPGVEQLDEATAALEELQGDIERGRDQVSEASQITQETIDTLNTGFADLEGSAQTLSASLGGYDAKLTSYLKELDELQASLPRWANVAAISLTGIFIWLGFSQAALFVLAWSFYRVEDLLARWRVVAPTKIERSLE